MHLNIRDFPEQSPLRIMSDYELRTKNSSDSPARLKAVEVIKSGPAVTIKFVVSILSWPSHFHHLRPAHKGTLRIIEAIIARLRQNHAPNIPPF
jgi:hypothetical protein